MKFEDIVEFTIRIELNEIEVKWKNGTVSKYELKKRYSRKVRPPIDRMIELPF